MRRILRIFRASIGSKQLVAVTGGLLVLFLVVHMLGNLTVYQGPAQINGYAAWLQGNPMLWAFRLGLLALVLLHLAIALRLALENRAARPQRYRHRGSVQLSFAARTMAISGLLVLGFIIYHLGHLTAGVLGPEHRHDAAGRLDVYANLVIGFSNPWIAWGYVAAMLLLGLHLHHAIQSLLHTLGLAHESWQTTLRVASPLLSGIIVLGFVSIPIAVQLGLLTLPGAPA